MVDVLILNYNDSDTVLKNINRIKKYASIKNILVVDNCSSDNSYKKLKKVEKDNIIVIKTEKNGGYGYGNNYGINYLINNCNSKNILLANPDTYIENDTIANLEKFLNNNKEYAIVAPFMTNKYGKKQLNTAFEIDNKFKYILSFSVILKNILNNNYKKFLSNTAEEYITVDAVSGSLFLCSAEKMLKYGMFDENLFLYSEETAMAMKLKKNKQKTALLPNEKFIHDHSVSINKTYKSNLKKRKINIQSRTYILKHYYKANIIDLLVAKTIGYGSYLEILVIDIIKKIKRKRKH